MTDKPNERENAIAAIGDQIKRLLVLHADKIFQGYKNSGDDDFAISISVKMSGGIEHIGVKTRISFSTEKINDNAEKFINMRQADLFTGVIFQEALEKSEEKFNADPVNIKSGVSAKRVR